MDHWRHAFEHKAKTGAILRLGGTLVGVVTYPLIFFRSFMDSVDWFVIALILLWLFLEIWAVPVQKDEDERKDK
jgi:hypothetical protein